MGATTTGVTVEEFVAGTFPPGHWLVEGNVIVNDPTFEHQRIAMLITAALLAWTREQPARGTAGFGGNWTIAPGTVYKPDVWWTAEGHTPTGSRSDRAPDLAVEIRSPGTWTLDVGIKRRRYEEAGVAELWLVDSPARSVLVLRRTRPGAANFDVALEVAAGETLTTPLLDGFEMAVGELFA
ncbi:MAG: Uma2 family endonuclease [Acidimicrobiales bacterium]